MIENKTLMKILDLVFLEICLTLFLRSYYEQKKKSR